MSTESRERVQKKKKQKLKYMYVQMFVQSFTINVKNFYKDMYL